MSSEAKALVIKCKLQKIKKQSKPKKTKYGQYLSSAFPIKGLGRTNWPVGVNIDLNYEELSATGLSDDEIVERCIIFLNTPPGPKKKGPGRPRKKPLYALFNSSPYSFSVKIDKNNKKYIQAILITNEQKNKSFWGAGKKINLRRKKQ